MKLSIVIPSYCADKHLKKCLDSVEAQQSANTEVIIVDCSPNDLVEKITKNYEFAKFVKVGKRFNPGEGRNIGVQNANGEYIVFIDADVVLSPHAIANIETHAASGKMIFGAALELNSAANNDFAAKVEHFYFNHESQSSRGLSIRNNLSSAFMIVNKNLFLKFGGFADIPRMQDTELTERMRAKGTTLYFCPDIIGLQIQDSPLKKVLNKIKITGNNLYYIRYQRRLSDITKIMFILILPLLMLYKITRINFRNLRFSFSLKMLLIYCPFMYVCGVYWMMGFYKGMIKNKGIEASR